MTYPQRKSPRLRGYDYAQEGAYFVTICLQHRLNLLGLVDADQIRLNPAGAMIFEWWIQLPQKFTGIEIDYAVVMPNHFHGIVVINRYQSPAGGDIAPPLPLRGLTDIMRWFKAMTTNAYIRGVKKKGWEPFEGQFWQRSYHDHIIRNEATLNKLREYILANPARWNEDRLR